MSFAPCFTAFQSWALQVRVMLRADIDCRCAVLLQYRGCAETVYLLPPEKREKTFGILLGAIATRILLTL